MQHEILLRSADGNLLKMSNKTGSATDTAYLDYPITMMNLVKLS
jgi:hypothetical protein